MYRKAKKKHKLYAKTLHKVINFMKIFNLTHVALVVYYFCFIVEKHFNFTRPACLPA